MNFKHVIIVSLILAILTAGVVSASEDIECNDTLSQNDIADAPISDTLQSSQYAEDGQDESPLSHSDDESVMEADDNEDFLGHYSDGTVEVELYDGLDITDKNDEIGYVSDNNGIKGTVTLKIDGKKVFSKKYTGNKYYLEITGKDVDFKKIGYGYHDVELTYGGEKKSDSHSVNFYAIPYIIKPNQMSVGENIGITITGEKLNGTATLYNRINTGTELNPVYTKEDKIIEVQITNGYGWMPLDKLTNGTHNLQLEYSFGTYEDVTTFEIKVGNNSPEFSSSLSATTIEFGQSILAKLTGPKAEGGASIYIDNDCYKYVRFNFGKMEDKIKGLSVGQHIITISFEDDSDSDLFYSTTYYVVVEHAIKLKLQKVKVKKSAKKLVIKAKLKIDGKAVKKKKLKFKFNNKKFTAKTDKKGVAKITIKKKILKKLKKGKKVKYQVSYDGKTVTQKVKVKK